MCRTQECGVRWLAFDSCVRDGKLRAQELLRYAGILLFLAKLRNTDVVDQMVFSCIPDRVYSCRAVLQFPTCCMHRSGAWYALDGV